MSGARRENDSVGGSRGQSLQRNDKQTNKQTNTVRINFFRFWKIIEVLPQLSNGSNKRKLTETYGKSFVTF